jgi:hypothetical protein
MSTEYQIAKATAAQYVRETAKAQVTLDSFQGKARACGVPIVIGGLTYDGAMTRLELCRAKAKEWADKAEQLSPKRIAMEQARQRVTPI